MATSASFGDENQGFQIANNYGPINAQFQPPRERPQPGIFIPFSKNPNFVDRGDILDRIAKKFNHHHTRVALVGFGGAGKSQLAIEYARRLHKAQESDGKQKWIFWVDSSTQATFERGFRAIAGHVELPGREDPKANILELVRDWLSYKCTEGWTLVIDNADDYDMFYDKSSGVTNLRLAQYLPQSDNGSILVTTRDMRLARDLTGHNPDHLFEIGSMARAESLTLLRSKLKPPPKPETAESLVAELGDIPLAIVQAAAYIQTHRPLYSPEQYLDDFREKSEKVKLLQHDAPDLYRGYEHPSLGSQAFG
ncbi:hypothetical protein VTJ04DRAFT_9750 [Mycothermus thermophilus]|uniref:uncharacterized protein n=1 Tax=Humicola insolens TaxID=85995 RepID=UPI0037441CD2